MFCFSRNNIPLLFERENVGFWRTLVFPATNWLSNFISSRGWCFVTQLRFHMSFEDISVGLIYRCGLADWTLRAIYEQYLLLTHWQQEQWRILDCFVLFSITYLTLFPDLHHFYQRELVTVVSFGYFVWFNWTDCRYLVIGIRLMGIQWSCRCGMLAQP